ncbi:hypothetical protein KIL84_012183 [Mauremys mutica]|uniref:Uncharacterized protein n=1 Tax=Mauremys mutica TaxID=74926 RepID=A0A9D3XF26_9SAUR|nr:hypothetical protein KIL84_012183 [Mauremys mutica]
MVALQGIPSTPAEYLTLMRRRKKRVREDIFCEILQSCNASDHDQRIWRANMTGTMEKFRTGKRSGGPIRTRSRKCIMGFYSQQIQMLHNLMDIQMNTYSATQTPQEDNSKSSCPELFSTDYTITFKVSVLILKILHGTSVPRIISSKRYTWRNSGATELSISRMRLMRQRHS